MANRSSPRSPPLENQVPNQMRIGIEIPLDRECLNPNYLLPRLLGILGVATSMNPFYRADVEALEEWANVLNFKTGYLGFSVEEPEITSNIHEFFLIRY